MKASSNIFSAYTVSWPSTEYENLKPTLLIGCTGRVRSALLLERAMVFLCKDQSNLRDAIERKQHPDLLWIEAPEGEKLKVESLKVLTERLGIGPVQGTHTVIVIPACDTLSVTGQNMLLKLLEEPPKRWVFLLSIPQPEQLLPTLRSRCHILSARLDAQAISDLPEKLVQMSQGVMEWIEFWQSSQGSSLIQDFELWFQEPRMQVFERLMEKAHKSPDDFLSWITTFERLLWLKIRKQGNTNHIPLFEDIQSFFAQPHLNRKLWSQHFLHEVHQGLRH